MILCSLCTNTFPLNPTRSLQWGLFFLCKAFVACSAGMYPLESLLFVGLIWDNARKQRQRGAPWGQVSAGP